MSCRLQCMWLFYLVCNYLQVCLIWKLQVCSKSPSNFVKQHIYSNQTILPVGSSSNKNNKLNFCSLSYKLPSKQCFTSSKNYGMSRDISDHRRDLCFTVLYRTVCFERCPDSWQNDYLSLAYKGKTSEQANDSLFTGLEFMIESFFTITVVRLLDAAPLQNSLKWAASITSVHWEDILDVTGILPVTTLSFWLIG